MNYSSIIKHYEDCLEKHGDTSLGVDWPDDSNVIERRYKVMLDIIGIGGHKVTLLDFGCGLCHLFEYMNKNDYYDFVKYSGLDISTKFIEVSNKKFPHVDFYQQDILINNDIPIFDYIIMNGVFTEKRDLSFHEMFEYFKTLLTKVFKKSKTGVSFNVMSKNVDWERDDLFHLPLDLLTSFLTKELSRNFVIRNDYGLYEYTVYLYK